jgi:GcrA cell cycle regulator
MTEATPGHWTQDRTEKLKAMWSRGLSAATVAKELGYISRSAVIRKVHRLGLERRRLNKEPPLPRQIRRLYRTKDSTLVKVKLTAEAPPTLNDLTIPATQRKTVIQLKNHHCRWPVGEPRSPDFFFCGSPTADLTSGKPYCNAHACIAYNAAAHKKR